MEREWVGFFLGGEVELQRREHPLKGHGWNRTKTQCLSKHRLTFQHASSFLLFILYLTPLASCLCPTGFHTLVILWMFAGHWPFPAVSVPQGRSGSLAVNACVHLCVYVQVWAVYQTKIKLFYCILSDRSSAYSSALSHLNKTSICNSPINRKSYWSGPHQQAALWLSLKPDLLRQGLQFIMWQDTTQGPCHLDL